MARTPDSEYTIEILSSSHDRSQFDCGNDALNDYLRKHSGQDFRRDLTRSYAMVESDGIVIAYYTLSASTIEHSHLPEATRKKLPRYPIPAALIGRLAVDRRFQNKGIARRMLADALHRTLAMSKILGIHAVVVDAKDDAIAAFYAKFGFLSLSDSTRHLYLPLSTIKATLE